MANIKRRIITVFLYVVIGTALIAALIFVYPVYMKSREKEEELARQRAVLKNKSAECLKRKKEVNDLRDSPEAVEKVAREKFGLCKEDETVLKYKEEGK